MNKATTLITGAGFAGSTIARALADAGRKVHLIDRRAHIGGNAFDELDAHGVLVHRYGPHIFHTNSEKVWDFLSRFTEWCPYEHRVLGVVDGKHYPFPINRDTLNLLYGLNLDEAGAAAFFERVREPREPVRSSEDVVLNSVGRDLYEKFFLNYTRKQWGLEPAQLKAGVAAPRAPARRARPRLRNGAWPTACAGCYTSPGIWRARTRRTFPPKRRARRRDPPVRSASS